MNLILGAGRYQRIEGATHQDRTNFPGIDLVFDLDGHWPIAHNVCESITATHVVEHLKSLINFMNQAWDVLRFDGELTIETPNAGVNPDLTHCDPTHVRCYRPYTFHNYFTPYGIQKFGYTNKAWLILEIKTIQLEVPDDVIYVNLRPIK